MPLAKRWPCVGRRLASDRRACIARAALLPRATSPPACLRASPPRLPQRAGDRRYARNSTHRGVERRDVAIGSREHHAALHRREDERGQSRAVDILRQPRPGRAQAALNGVRPGREIGRQPLAHRRIGLVQLERQAADRAPVGAAGRHDRARDTSRAARTRGRSGSGTSFQTGSSSISPMPLQYMSRTAISTSCLPGK